MRKDVIKVATEELTNPSLGVTGQIVSSHEIHPEPIRIDTDLEDGTHCLYYSLAGESYYFVLVLREKDGGLRPSSSHIEPNAKVYLYIRSEQKAPSEITELLGIHPTCSGIMGELPPHRSSGAVNECHYWCLEPQKDVPDYLEQKLEVLLASIEVCKTELKLLSKFCSLTFTVCYEGYKDWMGEVVLSPNQVKRIAELDASVWIDLYASGPDIPE